MKLTIIGAGSVGFTRSLMNDVLLEPALEGVEIRLMDVDEEKLAIAAEYVKKLIEVNNCKASVQATADRKQALKGADAVVATIRVADQKTLSANFTIPAKYGFRQTVGDTVGPGGWNRAIRNIPVFIRIARMVEKYSADAVIINYSNPMAILTQTLFENCSLRVTGLCHGILGGIDLFASVFGIDRSKVKITFAGTNHFWFITDVRIGGRPGYPMLKDLLGARTFGEYMQTANVEGFELHRDMFVASDLYHQYGYLPYPGDRHVCEFLPGYVNAGPERLAEYKIERTSIDERIEGQKKTAARIDKWISGEWDFDAGPSGETAAAIIEAVHTGREMVDDFNLLNRGQIANLPLGVVVETLGFVGPLGFSPGAHGPMPAPLAALTIPHCINQQLTMKTVTTGDKRYAFQALSLDPLCSHLSSRDKKRLAGDLWRANRPWLPKGLR